MIYFKSPPKKTRQGKGHGTKKGSKGGGPKGSTASKHYNKKYRGQGRQMKLIDYRGRNLKLGQKVRVEEDIPSENGMLYKNSVVKLDEWNDITKKIRVTDSLGKVWWVEPSQVSCSFLQDT